jgi:hypothetical protein
MYTYNTTLAWWKEFTRVPPFDFHDPSRRIVNSYFVMQVRIHCIIVMIRWTGLAPWEFVG